jgi:hypothetical protein
VIIWQWPAVGYWLIDNITGFPRFIPMPLFCS